MLWYAMSHSDAEPISSPTRQAVTLVAINLYVMAWVALVISQMFPFRQLAPVTPLPELSLPSTKMPSVLETLEQPLLHIMGWKVTPPSLEYSTEPHQP
jgi:hypothetical protein